MRNVLRAEYDQMLLLPACVEDWIAQEHPVRFIREVVAQTDLNALGIEQPNELEGGTCFDPSLLLSIWLYGYFRKVRSTRALERACREDLPFVWLSGNLKPDHNALWRFWNTNRQGLRRFFRHTVRLAMELDLVGFVVQAIDGTKLPALCAGRQSCSREHLERWLQRLEEQLAQLEAAMIQNHGEEVEPAVLPAAIQDKQRLRHQVQQALQKLEQDKSRRYCHPQEPEAVRVQVADGSNRFGYNAQASVDARAQVITAAQVEAQSNDLSLALPVEQLAFENSGRRSKQTMVDSGYCTLETIGQAEKLGLELYMPLLKAMEGGSDEPYHNSHFRYKADEDVVICPQGQELSFRKSRLRQGRQPVRIYRNGRACGRCEARALCTKARAGRAIDITGYEEAVERHRQRMSQPEARLHYRKRAAVVEPVFARIKQHGEFRRFTLRGLEGARTQWSMVCSGYNLQRIYAQWRRGAAA